MKKTLLITVTALILFAASGALAESVPIDEAHFPDPKFRSVVQARFDDDEDGVFSEEELAAATTLSATGYGITDLSGIEYFTALETLYCYNNQLTALDLSRNTKLTYLSCSENKLTSLNVSKCSELKHLYCYRNQLTGLDLTGCPKLQYLECSGNRFLMLDLSKNTKLESSVQTGYCSVTGAKAGYADLSKVSGLDLGRLKSSTGLIDGRYVKCYSDHLTLYYESGNPDISAYIGVTVTLDPVDIADAAVSLAFDLTQYNCRAQEPEVTVSFTMNGKAYGLKRSVNSWDKYDFKVTYEDNTLPGTATVTVTGNGDTLTGTVSKTFTIEKADLSGLPVIGNTAYALETLRVTGVGTDSAWGYDADGKYGKYYYADLEKGTDYTVQYTTDTATGITAAAVTGKGNFTGSVTLDFVKISAGNFPDDNFRSYVTKEFDKNGDGYLSGWEITNATSIYYSDNKDKLDDLKGIGYFTCLTSLNISGNLLEKLDLSKNTALTYLDCEGNYLKALDLSKNTKLTQVQCGNNAIVTLKLGKHPGLTALRCQNNRIKKLTLSGCPALESLSCQDNRLTALTVTKCPALSELRCGGNALTSLTLTACADLTYLNCENNKLTKLDLTNNKKLLSLDCSSNSLSSLDLSKNTKLQTLDCAYNRLTALDLKKNTKLTRLQCSYNPLTGLDLSKNKYLKDVDFYAGTETCLTVKAEAGILDLSKLKQLNLKKASKWQSETWNVTCKVKNGLLTVSGPALVSYRYKCSSKITLSFMIMVDIAPAPIKTVTLEDTKFDYAGGFPIEPDVKATATVRGKTVTLKKDTDYTVTYKNNVKCGTAKVTVKGMNLYKGTVTKTFRIVKCPIDKVTADLEYKTVTYDGSPKKPVVTLINGDHLTEKKDYTVKYTGNVNAGTARVTVKGKGSYTGTLTLTFTIEPEKIGNAGAWLEYDSAAYTGKPLTPKANLVFNGKDLTEGTDFTVAYKNNQKVGTATVTVTGKGNFTGKLKLTFKIVKE